MDTLTEELKKNGVYATSHSHTEWKAVADRAAGDYKAKKEGPMILIGHSLGADAVMEMADYLGDKGVAVALVVPVDGTQSFPVSANVARGWLLLDPSLRVSAHTLVNLQGVARRSEQSALSNGRDICICSPPAMRPSICISRSGPDFFGAALVKFGNHEYMETWGLLN